MSLFLMLVVLLCLFSYLELYPDSVKSLAKNALPYYAIKGRYIPDRQLVIRIKPGSEFKGKIGDVVGQHPLLSKNFEPIESFQTYNMDGFRPAVKKGPPQGILLGDSFIEAGESDDSTLSALLSNGLNSNVLNLGTSWWGPDQYLIAFSRFGIIEQPDFAVFCFFAGNDFRDMLAYRKWQKTGKYYDFSITEKSFLKRFQIVIGQLYEFSKKLVLEHIRVPLARLKGTYVDGKLNRSMHIQLKHSDFYDLPTYLFNKEELAGLDNQEILKELAGILKKFRSIALKNNIKPYFLYVPAKVQIYADYTSDKSGSYFNSLFKINEEAFARLEVKLEKLVKNNEIRFISAVPTLKTLLAHDVEPYYRHDSHWNLAGRKAVATDLVRIINLPKDRITRGQGTNLLPERSDKLTDK